MTSKGKKLKTLNINLKKEIFSYFQVKDILNLVSVCRAFKLAVENIIWYKFIKENYEKLKSDYSLIFSEMDEVYKLFIEKVESESVAYNICFYLSFIKIKNENFIKINKKNFFNENEMDFRFLTHIVSSKIPLQILDLYGNNIGDNEKNMIYLNEALRINNSIKELNLGFNYLGKMRRVCFILKRL